VNLRPPPSTRGGAIALCAALLGSAPGPANATPQGAPTTLRALYGLTPPTRLEPAHTALLLVDFQAEFFDGRLPLPGGRRALERAARLVRWAHAAGVWVVHVHNEVVRADSPIFALGSRGSQPMPELEVSPGDRVLVKHLAGAFSRTELDGELRARGIETLIVAGLMTHLAVAITASDGAVLGYRVIVAGDATATRALPAAAGGPPLEPALLQRAALAILSDRVADVLDTPAILALPLGTPPGVRGPEAR
jgi:nicotinamidase-related amidase